MEPFLKKIFKFVKNLSFEFKVVSNLPKTRSGKIMRRILRKIAANKPDELGDITTLSEPGVVDEIVKLHSEKTK